MGGDPESLPAVPDPGDELDRRVLRYFDGPAGATPTPDAGPPVVGRYPVLDRLGEGGMGVVFRARDPELGRDIALKVIRSDGAVAGGTSLSRRRFLREAWITGRLEHPNIVPVHELGRDGDGRAYYTMKLVHGRTLGDVIRARNEGDPAVERESGLTDLLTVVLKVCDAITFAHARGIVHRDLKPANVMVGSFGEVLVMDWGLALVLAQPGEERPDAGGAPAAAMASARSEDPDAGLATLPGDVLGTPGYMAPEQAAGETGAVDQRTDVFGVGAILYHVLSGNPPYWGRDSDETLALARSARLTDPDMHRARRPVPRELRAVCRRALAARREERYASVAELAADLRAFLDARPGRAWRDGLGQRIVKQARRHPVRATVIAAAALLATAVFAAVSQYRAASAESVARQQAEDRRVAAEQAEADRRFLAVLDDRQESDFVGQAYQRYGDLEMLVRYLEAFTQRGLLLEQLEPGVVWERVAAYGQRLPALGQGLAEGLFDLAWRLERSGILHAARLAAGASPPPWARPEHLAKWRELGAAHARLVGLWPRLQAILSAGGSDPWRQEVFRTWLVLAVEHEDRFEPLLSEAALRIRSGAELEWLARVLQAVRGNDVAARLLDQAIARDPGRFRARLTRGLVALAQHDLGRAFVEYQVALALAPDSVPVRASLGIVLAERGDLAGAEATFRRAIELDPSYPVSHVNLGGVLRARGDLAGAVAALRRAVLLAPGFAEGHANLGSALQTTDHDAEALAALRRAAELKPSLVMAHYNLGRLLALGGDVEGAIGSYRQALALDPTDPESWCNLGQALLRRGAYAEAEAALRRGHELAVKRPGWKYDSARWVRNAERLAAREPHLIAVAEGREAAEDGEDGAQAGLVAHARARYGAAARLYQEAFAADPGLVDDLPGQHRNQAARCAALAAAGRGEDAREIGSAEPARLRELCCQWLRADLAAWTAEGQRGVSAARRAMRALGRWLAEPDLETVRGEAAVAALPPEVARCFAALWRDVRQTLASLEPAR